MKTVMEAGFTYVTKDSMHYGEESLHILGDFVFDSVAHVFFLHYEVEFTKVLYEYTEN